MKINYNEISYYLSTYLLEKIFILRVLIHKHKCKSIPLYNGNNKAFVIGNGPSLNETLKNHLDILMKNDCFMVNHSIEYDCFDVIRPKYYVIVDPYYFCDGELNEKTQGILDSFKMKLKWNITIFLPIYASSSLLVKELNRLNLVNVVFLSDVSSAYISDFSKERLFRYWNRNIACPLSQTVLNTALSVPITMKYKEIYLVGADTSWIEMLYVDQKNNDLYSYNRHFYENDKYLISKYDDSKSNIADELQCIITTFKNYQILKEYAVYNGCHLFNSSSYSLIDTIERKELI